jgi:co-chaperonin GroES (HSP10)
LNINEVKALGEYVVCELIEETVKDKRLKSGLIMPAAAQSGGSKVNIDGAQKPAYLVVHDVGPKVPEGTGIEIGKEVACNMYDAAKVFGDNKMFMLFNYKSIMAIVDAER